MAATKGKKLPTKSKIGKTAKPGTSKPPGSEGGVEKPVVPIKESERPAAPKEEPLPPPAELKPIASFTF